MSSSHDERQTSMPNATGTHAEPSPGPRRWGRVAQVVAMSIIGGLIAGLVAWMLVPPRYEARARLHVATIPPRIIFETNEPHVDYETYQRTQLALIKSRHVLNAALREVANLPVVRLQVDPIAWLEQEIEVDFDGEILSIAMSDTEPDGLSEIVDAVKNAYLSEVVESEGRGRRRRMDKLQKIYDHFQQDLEQKRATLRELSGGLDAVEETFKRELAIEHRRLARRELWTIEIELVKKRAELEVRMSELDDDGDARPDPDAAELAETRRRIRILEAQAARLEEDIELLSERHERTRSEYVDRGAIRADIEQIEEAADRVGAEVEALKVELGAPDRVQEIERADAPRPDHSRRRLVALTVGSTTSLALFVIGLLTLLARPHRGGLGPIEPVG